MLLTAKPIETIPKHNVYDFLELFALSWYIFVELRNCRIKIVAFIVM